jgi:hypothetical protein
MSMPDSVLQPENGRSRSPWCSGAYEQCLIVRQNSPHFSWCMGWRPCVPLTYSMGLLASVPISQK